VRVAFGAAWLLCRIYPRAWPVWIAFATGCAVTRVMVQAHFLSDVVTGAVAAYGVVWLVWTRWGKPGAQSSGLRAALTASSP
jgi:membrane-associated phospholipid phosphatase